MMYMSYIEGWLMILMMMKENSLLWKNSSNIKLMRKSGKYKKIEENDEFTIKGGIHILIPKITSCPFIQLCVRESVFKSEALAQDKCKFIEISYSDIFDSRLQATNNKQMYSSQ